MHSALDYMVTMVDVKDMVEVVLEGVVQVVEEGYRVLLSYKEEKGMLLKERNIQMILHSLQE